MPLFTRSKLARLCGLAAAIALGACATPSEREAALGHVVAPEAAGRLRGATVYIACQAGESSVRDICREQVADEITVRGGHPVRGARADASTADDRVVADARAAGAAVVLVVAPVRVAFGESAPALTIGVGVGGFGSDRGGAAGGGVGVSAPIGDQRVATPFAATGRIIDVATGRTLWTARANVPSTTDLPVQFGSLAISLMDVASRDGLF